MCCSIISPYSLQSPHKYIIINLALLSKRGSSILDHPVFLSFVFVLLFTDECVSFLINNVIINSTFFLPYYLRQYYLCAIKKTRITLHFTIWVCVGRKFSSNGWYTLFRNNRFVVNFLTKRNAMFVEKKNSSSFFGLWT